MAFSRVAFSPPLARFPFGPFPSPSSPPSTPPPPCSPLAFHWPSLAPSSFVAPYRPTAPPLVPLPSPGPLWLPPALSSTPLGPRCPLGPLSALGSPPWLRSLASVSLPPPLAPLGPPWSPTIMMLDLNLASFGESSAFRVKSLLKDFDSSNSSVLNAEASSNGLDEDSCSMRPAVGFQFGILKSSSSMEAENLEEEIEEDKNDASLESNFVAAFSFGFIGHSRMAPATDGSCIFLLLIQAALGGSQLLLVQYSNGCQGFAVAAAAAATCQGE